MARKRNLTISEELELNWNDGLHSDDNERTYLREFEEGWKRLTLDFVNAGQTNLMFDPMQLVV